MKANRPQSDLPFPAGFYQFYGFAQKMISENSKYQRWYEELIESARQNPITTIYSEVHHILPRSCGGSDNPENLVRLDYRRHFLAHWLLTKFYRGVRLRKMQRALWAMTLPLNANRIVAGWQFDAAKRAIKDLALTPDQHRNRKIARDAYRIATRDAARIAQTGGVDVTKLAEDFFASLRERKIVLSRPSPVVTLDLNGEPKRRRVRRRRPRPGRKQRMALRAEATAAIQ